MENEFDILEPLLEKPYKSLSYDELSLLCSLDIDRSTFEAIQHARCEGRRVDPLRAPAQLRSSLLQAFDAAHSPAQQSPKRNKVRPFMIALAAAASVALLVWLAIPGPTRTTTQPLAERRLAPATPGTTAPASDTAKAAASPYTPPPAAAAAEAPTPERMASTAPVRSDSEENTLQTTAGTSSPAAAPTHSTEDFTAADIQSAAAAPSSETTTFINAIEERTVARHRAVPTAAKAQAHVDTGANPMLLAHNSNWLQGHYTAW